ncbi:MAG: hypothetical protein ACREXW_18160, partial [Gammaproteobacteria bacterium]
GHASLNPKAQRLYQSKSDPFLKTGRAVSHACVKLGTVVMIGPLPYAPELNPQEHIWDELREKEFPNRVFNHLDAVIAQLHVGLPRLAEDHNRVRGITAWPWIVSLNLNVH